MSFVAAVVALSMSCTPQMGEVFDATPLTLEGGGVNVAVRGLQLTQEQSTVFDLQESDADDSNRILVFWNGTSGLITLMVKRDGVAMSLECIDKAIPLNEEVYMGFAMYPHGGCGILGQAFISLGPHASGAEACVTGPMHLPRDMTHQSNYLLRDRVSGAVQGTVNEGVYYSSSCATAPCPPTPAPTGAPPTSVPTPAPPTVAPPTLVPPTVAPPTLAPPTVAPPTVAPPTVAPPTTAPDTLAPPTVAPPTVAPPTVSPPTVAPPTVAPPTTAPDTAAPPTAAPPTPVPPSSSLAGYTLTKATAVAAAYIDQEVGQLRAAIEVEDFELGRERYANHVHDGVPSLQDIARGAAFTGTSKTVAVYNAYWGSRVYADDYIEEALSGTGLFAPASSGARRAGVWRGVQLKTVWLAVVHDSESAVDVCLSGTDGAVDAAVALLDRAWGYYAGSLEGLDGTGSGVQVMALAEEMGSLFGTADGGRRTASVNKRVLSAFNAAQAHLQAGRCREAEAAVDQAVALATVPLLQGVLHYSLLAAAERGTAQAAQTSSRVGQVQQTSTADELQAVSWTFAASVLPRVAKCNSTAGQVLVQQLAFRAAGSYSDLDSVVAAVQSVYPCLALTCEDVGGHMASDTQYSAGLAPCGVAVPHLALQGSTTRLASSQVHTGGVTFRVLVEGVRVGVSDGPVGVAVRWEGGEVLQQGGVSCGAFPCVVLHTDVDPHTSTKGIAATALRNPTFVRAEVVTGEDGTVELQVTLKDEAFRAYSPHSERLRVEVSQLMLDTADRAAFCASEAMQCDCSQPGGGCSTGVTISSENPRSGLMSPSAVAKRTAASAAVAVAASVLPGSPSLPTHAARLSILANIAGCPSGGDDDGEDDDEDEEMDPTLNPLRLEVGPSNRQVNGAVVGNLALAVVLVLVAVVAVVSQRVKSRAVSFRGQAPEEESVVTVLGRAHMGWLIVPLSFLYAGAVEGGLHAALYSSTVFRVLGAVVVIVACTFPLYSAYAVSCISMYARYLPSSKALQQEQNSKQNNQTDAPVEEGNDRGSEHSLPWRFVLYMGWGNGAEWQAKERAGNAEWSEVHHLLFDGYKGYARYYFVFELIVTLAFACVSASEPDAEEGCTSMAWVAASILLVAFLAVAVLRPYIAPYETVMDSAIVGSELFMMVCVLVALQADFPEEHWALSGTESLAEAVVWLIIAKLILDAFVFCIDEYYAWREEHPVGSAPAFVVHLFCGCLHIKVDDEDDEENSAHGSEVLHKSVGASDTPNPDIAPF